MHNDETPADRLKQARATRFPTASEAARFLGLATPTYLAHENGTRKISYEQADFYARKYNFRTEWIMSGRGAKSDDPELESRVPVGAAPVRNAARHHNANPLLGLLQMTFAPDGSLRAIPGAFENGVAPLPPLHQTLGYIPEVAHALSLDYESRRAVALPGQPADRFFVVQDFIRLRPDSIVANFAVSVRIADSDIPHGLAPGDSMVIDPSDRSLDSPGFYLALVDRRIRMVQSRPVEDANGGAMAEAWTSPYLAPRLWRPIPEAEAGPAIVGRAVHMSAGISSRLFHAFSQPVIAAQPGYLERQPTGGYVGAPQGAPPALAHQPGTPMPAMPMSTPRVRTFICEAR
jgi:DNA-binding XRE family transcriptional regulator